MLSFLIRVFVTAFLLKFVLPSISDAIVFHGQFWPDAVVAGVLFAIVTYVVRILLNLFGLLTLGLGYVLLIFLFFLIPALQLMAMASWFPQYLTIHSFGAAIVGGFVLFILNVLTNGMATRFQN